MVGNTLASRAALVVGIAAIAGCTTLGDLWPPGESQGAADAGTGEIADVPSFAKLHATVLAQRCAGCHKPGPSGESPPADLDLSTASSACRALVSAPSCLFPARQRVVPEDPDASFLWAKLTGEGLGDVPDGPCRGQGNSRMPPVGVPLDQATLDTVRLWIAGGAPCEVDPGPGGTKVVSVEAVARDLIAGEATTVYVAISPPAPAEGVDLAIALDSGALTAPAALHLDAGQTAGSFVVTGRQPAREASLEVSAPSSSQRIRFRVGGLEIAEVFLRASGSADGLQWIKLANRSRVPIDLASYSVAAGIEAYGETGVQLGGTLAAGSCYVVGGPTSSQANGNPLYSQTIDFDPDLPADPVPPKGIAVFDRPLRELESGTLPVDVLVVGKHGEQTSLRDPDGDPAGVGCADPAPHASAVRLDGARCVAHPRTMATSCEPAAMVRSPDAVISEGSEPIAVDKVTLLDVGLIGQVTVCFEIVGPAGAEHIVQLASPDKTVSLAADPGAGTTCLPLASQLADTAAHGTWELRVADPTTDGSRLAWWSLAVRRR